jgi:hypothetical protein
MKADGQRTRAPVPLGEWIAGLGACVLLVSMSRPWYELSLPDEVLTGARGLVPRVGDLGPLLSRGIDELQRAGGFPVSPWDAFESADFVLAGAAAAVLAIVALDVTGALNVRLHGLVTLLGLIAAGVIAYRIVSPPLSSPLLDEPLLSVQPAMYAALIGAVAIAGGGLMALTAPGAQPAQTSFSIGTSTRLPHSVHDPS